MSLGLAALAAITTPVVAAGVPACCIPAAETATARPGCCPAKSERPAFPKGCCKAPEAPKPDAAVKHVASAVPASISPGWVAPAAVLSAPPTLVVVRAALGDHRAPSPDDSPPDLLTRNHILRI